MSNCPHCGDNTWTEGEGCSRGCHTVAELQAAFANLSREYDRRGAEIAALEARIAKADALIRDMALRALTAEHSPDEMFLIELDELRFQRDCDITAARDYREGSKL